MEAGGTQNTSAREGRTPPFGAGAASMARDEAEVDIVDTGRMLDAGTLARLRAHCRAAMKELRAKGEVRVRLVNDEAMVEAHGRHLKDWTTTDVLTFDLSAGDGKVLDTDLIVCLDEAKRNAAARSIAVEHELLLYILHGVLHCSGYGDADEESAAAMHRREDQILEAIGVGVTYGAPVVHPGGAG